MRLVWIMTMSCTLMSTGLLVIIIGQYTVMTIIETPLEKQFAEKEKFDRNYANVEFFKSSLEKQVTENTNLVTDLEMDIINLNTAAEDKKADTEACQRQTVTHNEDFDSMEQEHAEAEAHFKMESDSWQANIAILKKQLTEYREICNYTKESTDVQKLCGPKPA